MRRAGGRTPTAKRQRVPTHSQERPAPRVFDRGSSVHAYWVRRCVGFAVVDAHGRRLGRVRRAERERDELVVARRFGSRRVAVAAVESIWPSDRIILVSDRSRRSRAPTDARSALGDETLPWFDLVGAAAAVDETEPPTHRWIRARSNHDRQTISVTIRSGIRSSTEATRRAWQRFLVWTTKQLDRARVRSARGLIRLAAAIEPRSRETQ